MLLPFNHSHIPNSPIHTPPMDHDSASRMIKDDREKTKPERSVFAEKDLTDKVDSYWGRA
jgi:hypothetical protein